MKNAAALPALMGLGLAQLLHKSCWGSTSADWGLVCNTLQGLVCNVHCYAEPNMQCALLKGPGVYFFRSIEPPEVLNTLNIIVLAFNSAQ